MKKNHIKAFSALLLSAGILFSLTACGFGNDSDNGKVDVRIAYFPNITHTQALVMKNQNTLETAWNDICNVTWTSFHAGPAEIEAIFAGEIDLGYIGPVPALNANAKSNGEVKIISNATNAGAVLLKRKDSGIKTISDLAGKKVAVPQLGNTQHLCLLHILDENDLTTMDKGGNVTVTASSNADILNLMDNGSIDAALVPEPWGTTIEQKDSAEVLLDYDEIFLDGDYPTAVVIANSDFMEEHPDLVKEFLEMHSDTTLFINENPTKAQEIVNNEIKSATGKSLDTDVMENAFSRLVVTDTLNTDAILSFADISKEEGFITIIPEEQDVFDTQFAK